MSPVQMLIRDGNPWYLSPDIWVVPGTDPNGSPGAPVAGSPAYLWARVENTGDVAATNARLDYYWADPTGQVTRTAAHQVGSAFVTVPPGETRDVLCIVPWAPVIVNDGHECLVVVAVHPGDPLPTPVQDAFDPPSFRQVAQKNLTVLAVSRKAITVRLTLSGLRRVEKPVLVTAEIGGELDDDALASIGLKGLRPAKERKVEVGLGQGVGCVGDDESVGEQKLEVRVPRGETVGVDVTVRSHDLGPEEYQLVTVAERGDDEEELGGLGFVVIDARKEPRR